MSSNYFRSSLIAGFIIRLCVFMNVLGENNLQCEVQELLEDVVSQQLKSTDQNS